MAGYSGTPLPQKLGLKPGQRVFVGGAAPSGFLDDVEDVTWMTALKPPIDVAIVFVTREVDYRRRLTSVMQALVADGSFWVAWPKRSSGMATDMTEDVVRDVAVAETELVDNKVCAIDDTWSGLRLVVRVAARPDWPVQR
jgi:hypothetical protein